MNETIIKSIPNFHEVINQFFDEDQNNQKAFRGVCNKSYKLIPKIGRYDNYSIDNERKSLDLFKQRTRMMLDFKPEDDWEWLSIAQHYGLATRFLDWTHNPLVSLYFSVFGNDDADGAVYVMQNAKMGFDISNSSPFEFPKDEVANIFPNFVTSRINSQVGFFTVHGTPTNYYESENIEKLIIPKTLKKDFRWSLYHYGFHSGTIFPELSEVTKSINWAYFDSQIKP